MKGEGSPSSTLESILRHSFHVESIHLAAPLTRNKISERCCGAVSDQQTTTQSSQSVGHTYGGRLAHRTRFCETTLTRIRICPLPRCRSQTPRLSCLGTRSFRHLPIYQMAFRSRLLSRVVSRPSRCRICRDNRLADTNCVCQMSSVGWMSSTADSRGTTRPTR